jgi:hypothetical protein
MKKRGGVRGDAEDGGFSRAFISDDEDASGFDGIQTQENG